MHTEELIGGVTTEGQMQTEELVEGVLDKLNSSRRHLQIAANEIVQGTLHFEQEY